MASKDNKKLATKLQKSYFDVLGLCCSSEVPLVENILNSLDGIDEFSVIVPTKTVIVVHDNLLLSQLQIVKALNQARLEANVRVTGDTNIKQKLPSPYVMASGVLLLLAFLKYVFPPLKWLALGAVGVAIVPVLLKGFASMRNLRLDVNILVIIAVVGTVAMRDYIEAGTIVFLFTVGEWLESRASYKANAVMSSLISLAPQRAVIAETGEDVDADEVKVNTVLAVKAGEVIPIDGVVVDGKCEVDEKTLTGESFPVSKQKDSTVWAGTINLNGYISVKTTALATDCVVAKMTKLVEEAQNSKSSAQRFIDKCSQYYTPAIIILAAAFALVPFVFKVHNRKHWFYLALVFLVSGCPCALVLSTPVVTFCALTKAAAAGLLIKGGNYLEILAKVKTVAFDKTGTITRGEFAVTDFQSLSNDISLETLLYWVSSIESESSHPMAAALVDYARSRSIDPKPDNVEEFQNYPGEGIHGKIDGKHIYIGNRKIALRTGSATVPTADGGKMSGRTVGYIYCGATHTGIFSLSDACRTGAAQAIANLTLLGIKTAMLTGDNKAAAMQAQEQLGHTLEEVHAELLPEDKARIIGKYKKGGPTAMVGDGLNDTPALATADIGISMGISGSALASETGHVILMSNDIGKVPKAIQLARKAQRKVVENVILSITTKAAIIALAFAGHPLVWAAVLADVGTCLLVILNSMMLLGVTHSHTGTCCKSSGKPHIHKHGHKHSSHNHKHCCSSQTVEDACVAEKSQCCSSSCHSSQSHTHSCSGTTCKGDRQDKCRDAHDIHESKHCGQGACKTDHNEAEKTDPRHQCCSGPHHFSKHTEGDGPEDHKHCHHGTHKGSHDHSDNAFDLEEGGKISHEGSNHHQHQNKGCCDHGHHHHMELHPDSLEGHKHCHQSHDHSNLSHHDHPDHAHDHSTHPHGVHDHDHSDQAHDLEEGRKMSHSDHRESEHHDQNIALTHIIIDSPANNVAPCCSHSHHHHMDHSKKCCSGH